MFKCHPSDGEDWRLGLILLNLSLLLPLLVDNEFVELYGVSCRSERPRANAIFYGVVLMKMGHSERNPAVGLSRHSDCLTAAVACSLQRLTSMAALRVQTECIVCTSHNMYLLVYACVGSPLSSECSR